MKRAIDIVVALVLVAVLLPSIVLACVITALALRCWPLFTQDRVGEGGEVFRFLKIRTLPPGTPCYADKFALAGVQSPWFCRMLRRYHLDELPQLLLVLTGRMSLVGPRPEMPTLHRRLSPGFAAERTSVRPGCTGLWQIGNECHRLIGDSPEFDRFYVANQSTSLDLWILWRTVQMMLGGSTVAVTDVPAWAVRSTPSLVAAEPAIAPAETA